MFCNDISGIQKCPESDKQKEGNPNTWGPMNYTANTQQIHLSVKLLRKYFI